MTFLVLQLLVAWAYPIPGNQGFREKVPQPKNLKHLEEEIFHSLRLPHTLAIENLSQWGVKTYGPLKTLAFNEKIPMRTRWKSFMVYTQLAGSNSFQVINQALGHKDWFMRSAALTALESIDESLARQWALKKLNNDPALMVRTKALEILQKRSSGESVELFWKKLYSADSFYNNRSLWIRKSLAINLMEKPRKKDIHRWIRLLHGSDDDLQQVAAMALSRINTRVNKDSSPDNKDVSFWKNQYPDSRSL